MKDSEARTANMRVEKIAAVASKPPAMLDEIAYNTEDGPNFCRLLGHSVLSTHLRLKEPAICPLCVRDSGFIEAHWDLTAITGCSIHNCRVITSCPNCKRKLSKSRKGLLTCSCGADLLQASLPSLSAEERSLLDVLRRKVLRQPCPTDNLSGLPIKHLDCMQLRSLLGLIHALSFHARRLASRNSTDKGVSDTALAAQILSNWPARFHDLLASVIKGEEKEFAGFARGALGSLYHSLFKNGIIPDRRQVEFVLKAYVDFVANHWGGSVASDRLLKRFGLVDAERYAGIEGIARRLHIDKRTALRILARDGASNDDSTNSQSKRPVIDSHALGVSALLPGRTYSATKAASEISISTALLGLLRDAGDFEVRSAPKGYRDFHEKDIRSFICRMRASVSPNTAMGTSLLAFRDALHELRFSLEAQQQLMRGILKQKISLYGSDATAITDLLVRRHDLGLILKEYCSWFSETVTRGEAAKILGVGRECIRPLIDNGYLDRKITPIGERYTRSSAEQFQRSFISVTKVAERLATSERKLIRICRARGIFLLIVEHRLLHGLIKVEDEQRVRDAFDEDVGGKAALQNRPAANASACAVSTISGTPATLNEIRITARCLPTEGDTVARTDAADRLRVGRECIRQLLEKNYLTGCKTTSGDRITRESFERFFSDYISLREIAEGINSRATRIRTICIKENVSLLEFYSRGYSHSFAKRVEAPKLLEILRNL
jgi:hypothetical protein